MKFEELETVWAAQSPGATPAADLPALQRSLMPEVRRRGRMLRYGVFLAALGLFLFPVLAVANYRYAPPPHPVWHWVDMGFWMLVNGTILVFLLRAIRRQRALLRQGADTVRALTALAVASREDEMKDFRQGLWVVPCLLVFQLLSLYVKFPVGDYGWRPFLGRAGAIVGFTLVICRVFWRHYHVNLKPDQHRQQELLRDLS